MSRVLFITFVILQLLGLSIAFVAGIEVNQIFCRQMMLTEQWTIMEEREPSFASLPYLLTRLPRGGVRTLMTPCREVLLWQEVAQMARVEEMWVYHDGERLQVAPTTTAYSRLRAWGYRLFVDPSREEGPPDCLSPADTQALFVKERILEMRLSVRDARWRDVLIPTTGLYRGWVLIRFSEPSDGVGRLCGNATGNEAVVDIIDGWIRKVAGP